jgi:glutamate-1-semialdehyde 2,1-aminomutase
MAAGIATLSELRRPGVYAELERKTQLLVTGLQRILDASGIPAQLPSITGLLTLFFAEKPVHNFADAKTSDTQLFARYFWNMIQQGVYLPPAQFEACFISLALDDTMVQETISSAERALSMESLSRESKDNK